MKGLTHILLICGMINLLSLNLDAQIKYIHLNISQPNVEECITGIENTFKDCDLKIFPNPSNGVFTLEITNKSSEIRMDLSIYDISGKVLLEQQFMVHERLSKTIDLSKYKAGTYILNVRGAQNALLKANLIIY